MLFIFGARLDYDVAVDVGIDVQNNRPTTNLAILDVVLLWQ